MVFFAIGLSLRSCLKLKKLCKFLSQHKPFSPILPFGLPALLPGPCTCGAHSSLLLYMCYFLSGTFFPLLLLTFMPGFSILLTLFAFGYRVYVCCFIYSVRNSQCFCEAHLSFQESIPHPTLN